MVYTRAMVVVQVGHPQQKGMAMIKAIMYNADIGAFIRFHDLRTNIYNIVANLQNVPDFLKCSDSVWLIPGMEG